MKRTMRPLGVSCCLALLVTLSPWRLVTLSPVQACSICGAALRQSPTFREEAAQDTARLIVAGTPVKCDAVGEGKYVTRFRVDTVLRPDAVLGDKKEILIKRFMDTADKSKWLLFCDTYKGQIDPFRGVPIQGADAIDYVKKAIVLSPKDRTGNLQFFFRYLENADKEVARDAFIEFAKASDQDIAQVARKLSASKLRGFLEKTTTPSERLSVYALLLGACGGAEDARFLEGKLKSPGERFANAFDGILGGYMHLEPRKGWALAVATLRDGRKPLAIRLAVSRALTFYHGARPKESRADVLKGLEAMIVQGDLADLAVEDLRRWQMWDLTREVLSLYGKKGYDAPIMKRAIVRYALSCKDDPAAQSFVTERRRAEPDLVKEVEESLEYEKAK